MLKPANPIKNRLNKYTQLPIWLFIVGNGFINVESTTAGPLWLLVL